MAVTITSEALAAIHSHVAAEHPREACGLLLGEPGAIRHARAALNLSPRPEDSFEIDPGALFAALRAERSGGPSLLGFYHSHPNGDARPSPRDEAGATEPDRLWLIVAGGRQRLWQSAPTRLQEEFLTILP